MGAMYTFESSCSFPFPPVASSDVHIYARLLGDSDLLLDGFASFEREHEKRGRSFYQADISPRKRSRYSSIESAFAITNSPLSGFEDTVFGDPASLSSESYSFGHPSSPESGVDMFAPQHSHPAASSSSGVRLPSNSMQDILSHNEEGPKIVVEEEPEEVSARSGTAAHTLEARSMHRETGSALLAPSVRCTPKWTCA